MARSLNSILGDIHDMSDTDTPKDLFAMLYAEFGVGKTTTTMGLAQALRGDEKILFLDSSDGWVSLEEYPGLMEGADLFRVKDPKDIVVIANALATRRMKGYRVIVIDELSSIFDAMLEQFLREKHNLSDDEQMPEAEGRDYGPPTAAMGSFLRKLHELDGIHVLVTAHAREVQAEGGTKEIRASFPPKAYAEVMRRAHVAAALTARRKRDPQTKQLGYERTLQLKPSAAVAAKSRIRKSPITTSPDEFIELVVDWLGSEEFAQDMNSVNPQELVDNVDTVDDVIDSGDDTEEGASEDTVTEQDDVQSNSIDDLINETLNDFDPESPISDPNTRASQQVRFNAMKIGELRDYAQSEYDVDTKGIKKSDLIGFLLDYEFPEDEIPTEEEEEEPTESPWEQSVNTEIELGEEDPDPIPNPWTKK